jgi:hypothetical protein
VLEKIHRMTFQSLTTPTLNHESHDVNDHIVYSVLSGLQTTKIYFDRITEQRFVKSGSLFFHPFLHMKNFTEILINYSEIGQENLELISKRIKKFPITCVQGISISPNKDSGIPKFHIYATNKYNKLGVRKYEEETKFVQVQGIINIREEEKDNILLFVHHLTMVHKTRSDSYLPHNLYMYDFRNQWDLLEPSMIFRPAMMIPCFDRSSGFNRENYNNNSKHFRMWIIPYHTIDINGYDIQEIDENEIREIQPFFDEMNNADSSEDIVIKTILIL